MSERVTERGLKRREFMSYALALGGTTAAASVVGPSSVWGAVRIDRSIPSIPTFSSGPPVPSGAGITTSSGRSKGSLRWDCRASSRTRTRSRSIGAIRWSSRSSSMMQGSH